MSEQEQLGHWLSGFTDGEGCFWIGRSKGVHPRCDFKISLRQDDHDILVRVQEYLGGCGRLIRTDTHCYNGKSGNQRPKAVYTVSKLEHLTGVIIPHFDVFPLRSKKARDFAIWRRAVLFCAAVKARPFARIPGRGRGGALPKWTATEVEHFYSLVDELRTTRQYPG